MLLRVHKMPGQMSSTMNTYFTRMFPVLIFLYSLGQYLFLDRLSEENNWVPQLLMWISLAYLLFPYKHIDRFVAKSADKSDEVTHESYSKYFLHDYEKVNPVQFSKDEFEKEDEIGEGRNRIRRQNGRAINLQHLIEY